MSYRSADFERYFADILGGKPTSLAKYRSFLNRTDELAGGLDELVESQGFDGVRTWARNQTEPPFDKFPSDARSIVNSYLGFVQASGDLSANMTSAAQAPGGPEPIGAMFKIEKEMQAAIRRDLGVLEPGLAVDDGIEVTTSTGRVDILARDAAGVLTAIELKAGPCPSGAIEQALGYAQALFEERNEEVRAILIAGSFNERQKAASKRAVGLVLKTYTYQMSYCDVG